MHLMLMGHVGIVLAIPSVVLSFLGTGESSDWSGRVGVRVAVLAGGLFLLMLVANSPRIEKLMWTINSWALSRFGMIHLHDYTRLLRVGHDYVISELLVRQGEWLAGQTLAQLSLNHEGILVLGIEKPNGEYLGAPRGATRIEEGDSLVFYGRQDALLELAERQAGMQGNIEHMLAVTRQMESDGSQRYND